ncbi:hypothetical protein ACMS1M_003995 [Cronobacter dublinensis]
MKLIDLLVRELPKRDGWPDGAVECCRHKGANSIDFYDASGNWPVDCALKYGKDFAAKSEYNENNPRYLVDSVTRDQYEAALAAAQKQVWDGEGLPPVGCRIEAFSGGEWVEAIVTYNEPPECHGDATAWKEVLAFDCKTTRPFWTDEFRPIRSEADKKRDAEVDELIDAITLTLADIYASQRFMEAIAAGKVPGIRIE